MAFTCHIIYRSKHWTWGLITAQYLSKQSTQHFHLFFFQYCPARTVTNIIYCFYFKIPHILGTTTICAMIYPIVCMTRYVGLNNAACLSSLRFIEVWLWKLTRRVYWHFYSRHLDQVYLEVVRGISLETVGKWPLNPTKVVWWIIVIVVIQNILYIIVACGTPTTYHIYSDGWSELTMSNWFYLIQLNQQWLKMIVVVIKAKI